ncbi:hypothetical protein K7X08_014481 [Anisodus acutangulus]|uniref:Uncharacterized protein n=1 Tax=Anisodus acutangulus TaxID=402998 RepID=A0A9Q1R4E4_9SOLA|nr:hypothetical protein K7X08_014481 [Anisodus acutangulus]
MVNKLSSLLKVNDEKPLTRGRSCLKVLDDRESDVVNRKAKKVKFSPDNEIIEFTRSAQVKRRGRRLNVGILDSPVRVNRSVRMNLEDGVTEKRGGKRHVKDSIVLVNEVGVNTRRSMRNKQVVIEEKREETEGVNDGLRMSRRVTSRKNAKESVEVMEELNKSKGETGTDRVEKGDKKVTFISDGKVNESAKSETKAKGMKRETRRKSMTLHVQNEVDAEVREEVAEKPAQVTRSWNLKPVVDNVSNKRNRTKGKEVIEISEELLCTEFVESSVDAVKDEVRLNTRRSQQNSVVEASQKANKAKGAILTDDICKEKMVTRGRTSNQSSLTVQASTSESGTKIVEPKGKLEVVRQLEEPVEVLLRRSDRRKSVFPLEKLREERRRSRRNSAKANVNTKILDRSVQEDTSVVKEERRRSRRSAGMRTLAVVSDEKKENGEKKLTKKNCTVIQEKVSTNKLALQDLDSLQQSTSSSKASVEATVVEKTRSAGKKHQGRLKRSNVEVEVPMSEDMEIVRDPDNEDCNISWSEGTMSFSRSALNELEAVPGDVDIVLAETMDEAAAESSTLADKLNEEGPLIDANDSPSENNSASKCHPFNSDARPEENLVVELLQSDHEASASRDRSSSVLADDAVPNDITSDQQEHGAEEFISNEVLDNCSLSQSDNMENLDYGTKDEAAAELSTLADKLNEGPLVDANASPSENNSTSKCPPFSDPFNSNARPEENLVEELLQFVHKVSASKDLCPSSVFPDYGVPNDITSDKPEHADNAKEFDTGSSNEVLDNCSGGNMEEELDSGFKEQLETPCSVTVGLNYGEQELTVTDYAKEFDLGLSSSVSLENMGAFNQSNETEVKNSESDPMEQAEAESGSMEAKYDQDAPTFTNQCEIHAEEYANLEEATSNKAVLDLQEPGVLGDDIALHVTPSEDSGDAKQEEKKASSEGDSRDTGLNREEHVSPICGNDTSSLQSSVRDCGEHEQGEILKSLFATPFGSRSSTVEIATPIEINGTSSQYKHNCHEDENIAPSAGNGLTESVTPLKDTSNDEAREELKGLFATPSVASQSVGGKYYDFQSQFSGDAMTMGEGLGSSGKENLSESVGDLVEDKQGKQEMTLVASPVSVKCTNQETSSTKGKYSQSHEMETYICSGVKINLGECEDGSVGVDHAPETSHITAFNYVDENEQEDQLKLLFASPTINQTVNQMDGTSRKTEDKNFFLSRTVQGLSQNKGEMVRDTEMNTRHESWVQEIVDIEEHKIEETAADRDLLLRDTSKGLEEDICVEIANKSTSPVISEPTCDDIEFSEQQMVLEINKSSPEIVKTSDAFSEAMIINEASEMVGKEPKLKGFEYFGEPLTVEIISGGSDSTKRSCFSKEIKEQPERGPLFPTPSKGTSPLQLEESPGCEEDIFKDLDGDDTGEATLDWFQTNNGSVPSQTELETLKENDSAHQFEPLHEKGEVTEDDALAEGKEDGHLIASQESIEDRLINTMIAEKGAAVSDAVCQQPNILTDIETENITQESIRMTDDISVSAESGILGFDAESTALRSQEKIIITVEETKGDEVQKLEVRNISNAFLHNIPNNDEYTKEVSTVLPADEQFHFPEHHVLENVSSTEEFTASTDECQDVFMEDDLVVQGDVLIIFESNERMSMNVNESSLTTQQEEDSFDKEVHESTEAVLYFEEDFAGEDTLMSEKKSDLAEMKVPLTPAGVCKTSFAKHLNSTVKKKNARTILIHGTPNKLSQNADMKENAPSFKGDIGTLTASRPEKRCALKILP